MALLCLPVKPGNNIESLLDQCAEWNNAVRNSVNRSKNGTIASVESQKTGFAPCELRGYSFDLGESGSIEASTLPIHAVFVPKNEKINFGPYLHVILKTNLSFQPLPAYTVTLIIATPTHLKSLLKHLNASRPKPDGRTTAQKLRKQRQPEETKPTKPQPNGRSRLAAMRKQLKAGAA
jgi:hypothetical protein